MVANYLGIDANEVLEGAADDDSFIQSLNSLLEKVGTKCVIFFYQEGGIYAMGSLHLNI